MKLIHELKVHLIELELQNEDLMLSRSNEQEAAEKNAELYDFAPSGFFTLSREGEIFDININGAKILIKERSHLINSRFGLFISRDTQPIFNLFLTEVFNRKVKEECEVTLSQNGNLPMYVHLTGIVKKTGNNVM